MFVTAESYYFFSKSLMNTRTRKKHFLRSAFFNGIRLAASEITL